MRLFSKFPILLCLLFYCNQGTKVDPNLYGTWMVIGFKSVIKGYGTTEEKGYPLDKSMECYRISNENVTHFIRGFDNSLSGNIEFYDSVKIKPYSAEIDESTIILNNEDLSYSIRNICGATILKLSQERSGYSPYIGMVTGINSQYCIKVTKDSLPFSWPTEADVIMPDSNCKYSIDDLNSW